jgi:four helix bundle protein
LNLSFISLVVFEKSLELAKYIYKLAKSFQKEATYSLTNQMKRSSRSSANNSAEAYRKRRYPNHFISKGTDNNAENSDTEAA